MTGNRVKLQGLSNTNLTQNLEGYADLNTIGTLGGTISASSVTGTLGGTLSGTYATDVGPIGLALKEAVTKINAILAALT